MMSADIYVSVITRYFDIAVFLHLGLGGAGWCGEAGARLNILMMLVRRFGESELWDPATQLPDVGLHGFHWIPLYAVRFFCRLVLPGPAGPPGPTRQHQQLPRRTGTPPNSSIRPRRHQGPRVPTWSDGCSGSGGCVLSLWL